MSEIDASIKSEVYSCIQELRSIANSLEHAANEVEASIQGMSTRSYSRTLRDCADQYRRAANRLSKIR